MAEPPSSTSTTGPRSRRLSYSYRYDRVSPQPPTQHQKNDDEVDGSDYDSTIHSGSGPRRLVATHKIQQDTLIFCERPLLALQSTDGGSSQVREGVLVCHSCHCFVGSPEMTLKIKALFDPQQKTKLIQQITTTTTTTTSDASAKDDDDDENERSVTQSKWKNRRDSSRQQQHDHDLIPCRYQCGHVYCSMECQRDDWMYGGHAELCTGWISDDVANNTGSNNSNSNSNTTTTTTTTTAGGDKEEDDDPDNDTKASSSTDSEAEAVANAARYLLKFKRHALETNEIFLLIAVWLARILKQEPFHHNILTTTAAADDEIDDATSETVAATTYASSSSTTNTYCQPCYESVASPMTDFCMIPWWDVARNEIMAKYHLSSSSDSSSSSSPSPSESDENNNVQEQQPQQQLGEDNHVVSEVEELDNDNNADDSVRSSLKNGFQKAKTDADELDTTLRRLCCESVAYLNRAWAETTFVDDERTAQIQNDSNNTEEKVEPATNATSAPFPPPPLSSYDAVKTWLSPKGMALLIGSLEQNCLGIRRKHPIQYNILHNDDDIRQKFHSEIIQCLENAGMIGCDDDDEDEEDDEDNGTGRTSEKAEEEGTVEAEEKKETLSSAGTDVGSDGNDNDQVDPAPQSTNEEWDYSCEEINEFLAGIMGGNVFSVGKDDEWDDIFDPFDGTAHFSMISKMNHSCEPNLIVLYKTSGWGRNHPLVAYCVALRDISEGEELTISYIDTDATYSERQLALANYGFICECGKCKRERDGTISAIEDDQDTKEKDQTSNFVLSDEDDLFGDDSDDEESEKDLDSVNSAKNGHETLENMAERVESYLNHSDLPLLPVKIVAPAFNYVLKTASAILPSFQNDNGVTENDKSREDTIRNILNGCIQAAESRDFSSCRIVGPDLEEYLLHKLLVDGSWPDVRYREAYCCAAATAAIGYARECSFLVAMQYLDKAAILGLRRAEIEDFFAYVELFSFQMASGPYPLTYRYNDIPKYPKDKVQLNIHFGRSIENPVDEISFQPSFCFQNALDTYHSTSLVIRGVAANWPATTKWRSLDYMVKNIGRRLVPIEIGGMSTSEGMKEAIMEVREFVESCLCPSTQRSTWKLGDATNEDNLSHIAYLAQHPLLDQIPFLYDDVQECPLGVKPTNVNVWIGTGGTRTPLHFDSYDNLLVQVAGIKLVRLYHPSETSRLYVRNATTSKDSQQDRRRHDLQGNMSAVDCELEDFGEHPLAKDCTYYETLLFPGDLLFIPSGHWHYVRSLTTSISVNYWF